MAAIIDSSLAFIAANTGQGAEAWFACTNIGVLIGFTRPIINRQLDDAKCAVYPTGLGIPYHNPKPDIQRNTRDWHHVLAKKKQNTHVYHQCTHV